MSISIPHILHLIEHVRHRLASVGGGTFGNGGLLKRWFGSPADTEIAEHPMNEAMASSLKQELAKRPAMLNAKDDQGWTLLHNQALAGSAATVAVLLECGADPNSLTKQKQTPLKLAKSLGWDKVITLLVNKGAK